MTPEYLSQKLRRARHLGTYLSELAILTGRTVDASELSSSDRVSIVREAAQKFCLQQPSRVEVPFSGRRSERFAEFIEGLHGKNPCPVSIWTPRTIDCGMIYVPSILAIRFDFDFSINVDGIVSFLTEDLEDNLVLDFSEANANERILQIDAKGPGWGKVVF